MTNFETKILIDTFHTPFIRRKIPKITERLMKLTSADKPHQMNIDKRDPKR